LSSKSDRADLISFFENIADHHLFQLFDVIHEIKNVIEFEDIEEKITFEMFAGLLWRYTAGITMIKEGKGRVFLEDIEEETD
jgi:hypothetical protein